MQAVLRRQPGAAVSRHDLSLYSIEALAKITVINTLRELFA